MKHNGIKTQNISIKNTYKYRHNMKCMCEKTKKRTKMEVVKMNCQGYSQNNEGVSAIQ